MESTYSVFNYPDTIIIHEQVIRVNTVWLTLSGVGTLRGRDLVRLKGFDSGSREGTELLSAVLMWTHFIQTGNESKVVPTSYWFGGPLSLGSAGQLV